MTGTEIAVIVIGVFASIMMIFSALSTNRSRFLIYAIIASVLAIFQFGLAGAWVAAAVIIVGVLRNFAVLLSIQKPDKLHWLNHWAVMLAFMGVAGTVWSLSVDWAAFSILFLIPIVTNILGSVAVFFKNLIYTKALLMCCGAMWFVYEISYGAYGALLGEAATFAGNAIALVILIKAAKTGRVVIDPTTEVIKAITTTIPAVTTAIPVITSSISKLKSQTGNTVLAETGEFRALK